MKNNKCHAFYCKITNFAQNNLVNYTPTHRKEKSLNAKEESCRYPPACWGVHTHYMHSVLSFK